MFATKLCGKWLAVWLPVLLALATLAGCQPHH